MAARRKCNFNANLAKEFPFLCGQKAKDEKGNQLTLKSQVYCNFCKKSFSIANGGRNQIMRHLETELHKRNADKTISKMDQQLKSLKEDNYKKSDYQIPIEVKVEVTDEHELFNDEEQEPVLQLINNFAYQPITQNNIKKCAASCFLCGEKETVNFHLNLEQNSNPAGDFLLKNILNQKDKLSNSNLIDKLSSTASATFLLCSDCHSHIQKALQIKQQIRHLELNLKQVESLIFSKIKGQSAYQSLSDNLTQSTSKAASQQTSEAVFNEEEGDYEVDNFSDPRGDDDDNDDSVPEEASPSIIYYCGHCHDRDNVYYKSKLLLEEHTEKYHGSSNPSSSSPPPSKDLKRPYQGRRRKPEQLDSSTDSNHKKVFKLIGGHKEKQLYPTYNCPSCPEVKGYFLNAFAQHLNIHQRRPFKCSICQEFLPNDNNLKEEHWNKHNSTVEGADFVKFLEWNRDFGPFWRCQGSHCSSTGFLWEEERDQHERNCKYLKKHRKMENYGHCSHCSDKPFRNLDEWRLHRISEHPQIDKISCFYCNESFLEKTKDGGFERHDNKLHNHIKEKHSSSVHINFGSRLYEECESCGLVFEGTPQMQHHFQKIHGIIKSKMYICRLCGHSVSSAHNLRHHITFTHFGNEQSTICDICGVQFVHGNSLLDHKLVDHKISPENPQDYPLISCPIEGCGFQCLFPLKMKAHRNSKHQANDRMCRFCGAAFKTASQLKRHEDIHTNKDSRPWKCAYPSCDKSFAVRNYLNMHTRIVHENRPYPSTGNRRKKNLQKTQLHSINN